MRKFLFLAIIMIAALGVKAQNVQLHYDFGSALYDKELDGRPVVTTTVEMFKPDKWGSTYFFVDMDYTSDGVAAGYWEIARDNRPSPSMSNTTVEPPTSFPIIMPTWVV